MDCPRCEQERAGPLTPERVAAMVEQIPIEPSLKAEKGVYEKRIEVCSACESLREKVMCAYCGCFIFFRARPVTTICPHPDGNRWATCGACL